MMCACLGGLLGLGGGARKRRGAGLGGNSAKMVKSFLRTKLGEINLNLKKNKQPVNVMTFKSVRSLVLHWTHQRCGWVLPASGSLLIPLHILHILLEKDPKVQKVSEPFRGSWALPRLFLPSTLCCGCTCTFKTRLCCLLVVIIFCACHSDTWDSSN